MAGKISDYFTGTKTPDHNYLLTVTPKQVWGVESRKNTIVQIGDDKSELRGALSTQSSFLTTALFEPLEAADAAVIFDLFNDPAKACANVRSWKMTHPGNYDTGIYTVRFEFDFIKQFLRPAMIYGYAEIPIRFLGVAP